MDEFSEGNADSDVISVYVLHVHVRCDGQLLWRMLKLLLHLYFDEEMVKLDYYKNHDREKFIYRKAERSA